MGVVQGVVFDLDDTLYLERDFVRSGFRWVAHLVAAASAYDSDELFDHLWGRFSAGLRGSAFDDLLAQYPVDDLDIEGLVSAYRSHHPQISLDDETRGLLVELGDAGRRVGVISDGPPEMQANKASALDLDGLADPIVLTGEWGVEYWKPHPRAFRFIEDAWELVGSALTYVADNPGKDFVTPRRRGWRTIRLRVEGQLHYQEEPAAGDFAAEAEAESMADVARFLHAEGLDLPA